MKFVLVAEENNEIKTEKYLFYQKIVKVFTPITFDELVSEFETPEFLKIRNFDLKNLLVYVNNKIKNNQINFPMVNYKINDDFLNYKREILFKRTFYQIYEK